MNQISVELQRKEKDIQALNLKIKNKEYALNAKKDEVDGEIIHLRKTVDTLKESIFQRSEYLHPMIVEDFKQQVNRLHTKIDLINKNNEYINNNYAALQEQLKIRRGEVNTSADEMQKLNKSVQFYSQQV